MKIILQDVTVNQTSLNEVDQKDKKTGQKTGEIVTYRNVDIFIPRDVEDQYSKSKAITAACADTREGIQAFNYLQTKEGSRVSLLVDHKEAFSYKDKTSGQRVESAEAFRILQVIDSASIKPVEMPKNMKVAA